MWTSNFVHGRLLFIPATWRRDGPAPGAGAGAGVAAGCRQRLAPIGLALCLACAAVATSAQAAAPVPAHLLSTPIPVGDAPRSAAPTGQPLRLTDFSVVEIRGKALADARGSGPVGALRQGGGIVIDDQGLVLTIGYLVTETESIEIIASEGVRMPASLVAFDSATGLGLVRAALPLGVNPIRFADSMSAEVSDPVLVVGFDGVAPAYIVARREFAGGWEYLLDDALFTAPATTGWSGAALINRKGELLGVGALLLADVLEAERSLSGNMFVPIDLLKPILSDLVATGRSSHAPRPWLGVNVQDVHGKLLVTRVAEDGPAEQSGVSEGDIIVGMEGEPIEGLASFYRRLWDRGGAGVEVSLDIVKTNEVETVNVKTMERTRYLRPAVGY